MNLEELIKKCIKQDRRAQEELYYRYSKMLFTLSMKYCRNQSEAEDNLHNTFIEIFTNIKKYKFKGSFEGWMKRIAINKAITLYKDNLHLSVLNENIKEDVAVEVEEVEGIPLDYLLKLIQDLPHQYRLVFCMYQLDDYSHKEIAKMLRISESTSKSNLHRAKVILKQKIMNDKQSYHIHEK